MRRLLFLLPVFALTVSVVSAQTQKAPAAGGMTNSTTWKCTPPNPAHMLPAPDAPNHMYGVDQFTCTATKGEINGVKQKDGAGTEFMEATGNNVKGHGVFVETLANGDKINYSYTFTGVMANNMMQSGSDTGTVVSGTGKFKGITGKVSCKAKGNPDGSANFDCTGNYAMGK